MADRRPPGEHPHRNTWHDQLDLLDWGRTAAETRAASARAAQPRQRERQERIFAHVAACAAGATRSEISEAMGWPIQSVTSPVLRLLRDGRLRENGERRLTPYGRSAAVIVAADEVA